MFEAMLRKPVLNMNHGELSGEAFDIFHIPQDFLAGLFVIWRWQLISWNQLWILCILFCERSYL